MKYALVKWTNQRLSSIFYRLQQCMMVGQMPPQHLVLSSAGNSSCSSLDKSIPIYSHTSSLRNLLEKSKNCCWVVPTRTNVQITNNEILTGNVVTYSLSKGRNVPNINCYSTQFTYLVWNSNKYSVLLWKFEAIINLNKNNMTMIQTMPVASISRLSASKILCGLDISNYFLWLKRPEIMNFGMPTY